MVQMLSQVSGYSQLMEADTVGHSVCPDGPTQTCMVNTLTERIQAAVERNVYIPDPVMPVRNPLTPGAPKTYISARADWF